MMDERRDELSTADLAGQRPTTTERPDDRVDDADLDSRQGTLTDDREPDTPVADERAEAAAEERAPERVPEAATDAEPGLDRPRVDDGQPQTSAATAAAGSATGPLLGSSDAEGFRARWTDVQTGFVDAPREAVERADGLVAEVMQHLAKTFADARNGLERQWDRGGDVSTDDLRAAFQRYRSFFERLLST
jgi:hypothetical protein